MRNDLEEEDDIERVRLQMATLLPAGREYPADVIRAVAASGGWRDAVHELLQDGKPVAFEAGVYVANATADAGLFLEIWVVEAGAEAGGYKWSRHGARSDNDWNSPFFSCAIPEDLTPRHCPRDLEQGSPDADPAALHWAWATAELAEFERTILAMMPSNQVQVLRRSSRTSAGTSWIERFPGISPGFEFFYIRDRELASLVDARTNIEVGLFAEMGREQGLTACRQARAGLARSHPHMSADLNARLRELAEVSGQIRLLCADSRAAGAAPIGRAIPIRQRGLL